MSFQHYIETIRLSNFLSFEEVEVRLNKDLNILIGVNGSGKSNFLQAFNLLHALPTKFWEFFNTNGSIEDWAYKEAGTDANITVEATLIGRNQIRHFDIALSLV